VGGWHYAVGGRNFSMVIIPFASLSSRPYLPPSIFSITANHRLPISMPALITISTNITITISTPPHYPSPLPPT
jgi:hypothetical protein